jgi:hypothetical protein
MMRRERDGACFELVSGMAVISRRANVTAPVDLDYNVGEAVTLLGGIATKFHPTFAERSTHFSDLFENKGG